MATVLGVSAHYHDAAACLVRDGAVVAAVQQERISRVKNDASFPAAAIAQCLRIADVDPGAIDRAVFYEQPFAKLERVMRSTLTTFPHGLSGFVAGMARQLGGRVFVLDHLREHLGLSRDQVMAVPHHQSHAASAYLVSGAEPAAVLVVDGVGENETTSIWHGTGGALVPRYTQPFPDSLGLFYAAITAYLGFAVNEGEYKVMGLAAFGQPRLEEEFAAFITVHDDGSVTLDRDTFLHMVHPTRAFGPRLEQRLGPARPFGRPWRLFDPADAHYADVAATAQAVLETALLRLARTAHRLCGDADTLCLAGGVALNVRAVRRVLDEGPFHEVFVAPAAGDAGGAMGAALLGAQDLGDDVQRPLADAALGAPADAARAQAVAASLGFAVARPSDLLGQAARVLDDGGLLAVCRGRSEWGPRALGHRSLLARPRPAAVQDRINAQVKRREPFRPLAPVTTRDAFDGYFGGRCDKLQRFMTVTNPATAKARRDCPAALHVDGTARAQLVEAASDPWLTGLLARTAEPVLLNTSLNAAGEPICDAVEDALLFLMRHRVAALVVDDLWIERGRR